MSRLPSTSTADLTIEQILQAFRDAENELLPRSYDFVWSGWAASVGYLGVRNLLPAIEEAFSDLLRPTRNRCNIILNQSATSIIPAFAFLADHQE
jgi:hypothetical protein